MIIGQKRWMRQYFEELAVAAGLADPADFADGALLLYEGATVAASAGFSDAVRKARRTAEILLKA
ncbi:hypothetical protein [Saccharopolyspora pogona]|uniref:hypothetical protein n=1 Tax=Saccharopolyspora pogona TaxID=333966 RepID=UPI0016861692|nr:hypothetical protein [Saccharopolyspora pogona]